MDEQWSEFLRDLEQVRAISPAAIELRADSDEADGLGVLTGHFSVFNAWYEVNSVWEGRFLERIAPGAFRKTLAENQRNIRVLFNHGHDPSIGEMVLGDITDLREDKVGAHYEVDLFDTSYNRDLLPGLKAGVYGASFRFRPIVDEWNDEPGRSDHNPEGIPERTIREVRTFEFGPVTFPASPSATAGVRSMTDAYYEQLRSRQPALVDDLLARSREVRTPELRAAEGTRDEGAAPPANEPPVVGHSEVQARLQQRRVERLRSIGIEPLNRTQEV